MTTQVLKQAGLHLGENLNPADPSNADGHFEDIDTVALHDRWLKATQSSWLHTSELPVVESEEARSCIQSIASRLSCGGKVWGVKDPRACLFLPYWFSALDDSAGVFTYRHFASCHESLLRRHGNDLLLNPAVENMSFQLFSLPTVGLRAWLAYNKGILAQIKRTPDQCLLVSQEAMLSGFPLVEAVNDRFNLRLNKNSKTLIDESKVHHHRNITLPPCDQSLMAELETTYTELQALSLAPAARQPEVDWHKTTEQVSKRDISVVSTKSKDRLGQVSKPELNQLTTLWNSLGVPLPVEQCSDDKISIDAPSRVATGNQIGKTPGLTIDSRLAALPTTKQVPIEPDCGYPDTMPDFSNRAAVNAAINKLDFVDDIRHLLETGIAEQPESAFLHGLLGRHFLGLQRTRDAYIHFSKAIELHVKDASIHFQFALLQLQNDHVRQAAQSIRNALGIRRNADHLCLLIRVHVGLKEFSEAQRLSLIGYEWFPDDERFVLLHADALAADQSEKAAVWWCKTNDHARTSVAIAKKLYALENRQGNSEQATHYHREMVRRQLKQSQHYRNEAGNILARLDCSYTRSVLINNWTQALRSVLPSVLPNETKRASVTAITLPRVAMSILVRDEVDVIEENIRYHASHGVSHFIVTDNGSIDGTRERLAVLQKTYSIDIIDEPSHTIDQDLWVTRMAKQLQYRPEFDWIIHNDADEFWVPEGNSIPKAIASSLHAQASAGADIGVLSCSRLNMLPAKADVEKQDYAFHDNVHAVLKTVALKEGEQPWCKNNSNCIARQVMNKVITRSSGLTSVEYGNHGAEHELSQKHCDAITVLHFPVRTYEQFEKKVVNYGESLARNTRFSQSSSLHLRYWHKRFLQGELPDDYAHLTFDYDRLTELCESGHARVDNRVANFFKTVSLGTTAKSVAL